MATAMTMVGINLQAIRGMIVIVTLTKLMNPVVTVCVNRNENGHTKEILQHERDGRLLYVLYISFLKFTKILSD